ncbi:MAG: alpha/beta fold hydrolase [Candidatus Heimdallarchaeota archaeon]|nr:alpha/beta fold hydrolase [Candidatus Heimdallarchaeota archaeon]
MIDLIKLREACDDSYHLLASKDGTKLFLREWRASKISTSSFLIFHGITAHSGLYGMIGKRLSEMGYSTYGLDLRGHGLSEGPRGDYVSKDKLSEDIEAALDFIKSKHEKIVLIGHSLGVVTSAITINLFPELVSGLIFLSAAREVREGAYTKRAFTTTVNILLCSIFKPSKPVIHYYREGIRGIGDPLFNFYYTLRFLKTINPQNFVLPEEMAYPIFVGVGESDELFSVDATKAFFEEIPSETKEFAVLPGAKHAHFEETSFDPMFNWIKNTFNL